MRFTSTLLAIGAITSSVSAENYLGFNSGATKDDGTAKFAADFEAEFKTAAGLENAPGTFNAVRLYTNIQAYSKGDPIQAFEAAIKTKTKMLLGVWASGTDSISGEITALQTAVKQYGTSFTDLVIGISIGSEDLYRDSVTGVKNKAGVGASPDTIIKFIKDFKEAFASSSLSSKPVGHVDTWDVWPNSTIKAVIDAVDFIGVNEFPYYENDKGNNIKNSGQLFDKAYDTVLGVAGGKPVWLTETGWPYTGPVWDQAEATVDNAKYYWNEVGCRRLFGKTTAFWYTLRDSNPDNKMKFAITDKLSTKARFDLSCPTTFETPSSTTNTTSSASSTATGSSGSGSNSTVPVGSGSGSSSSGSGSGSSGSGSSGSGSSGSGSSGSGSGSGSNTTSPSSTASPLAGSGAGTLTTFSVAHYAVLAVFGGVVYLL